MLAEAQETLAQMQARVRELETTAFLDPLTRLYNARGLQEILTRELDRTNRGLADGGLLVLIDIDNFGDIRRLSGRRAMNSALRLVGRALAGEIRAMDAAARMKNDEFILLLADTCCAAAVNRAETLIRKLNNLSFISKGEEICVRASLGFLEYHRGDDAGEIFSHLTRNFQTGEKEESA
jgi:diguanylate cyclase (GGDEF)-like protein